MTKYYMYYIIAVMIILLSIIGIRLTTKPVLEYHLVDFRVWTTIEAEESYYSLGEELYIYSNVETIDYVQLENNEDLKFYNAINNVIFSLRFNNLSNNGNYPIFYPLDDVTESNYKGYRLIGKLEFGTGSYRTYVDYINIEEFEPYATTPVMVDEIIHDYSDYVIIPILTSVLGLMLFTMTYLSKKRHVGDKKYDQGKHSSLSRKREKY